MNAGSCAMAVLEIPYLGRVWKEALSSLDLSPWLAPGPKGEPPDWKLYRRRHAAFLSFAEALPGDPIYLQKALEKFLSAEVEESKLPPIVTRGRRRQARAEPFVEPSDE